MLDDLVNPEVRSLFRAVWGDPKVLDPWVHAEKVTEDVAGHLAGLARMLTDEGHDSNAVAAFLMGCVFTMFAEDVGLIAAGSFAAMIETSLSEPDKVPSLLRGLWTAVNDGGMSSTVPLDLMRFANGILSDPIVLPLRSEHLDILLEVSRLDWKFVEPTIFGTLLECALNPSERHKLGVHYTPRAYVERLVIPTVMEPLRTDWDEAQATAGILFDQGKDEAARRVIEKFREKLLATRVLDPACGCGNFLYVAMEHIRRLECEVLRLLAVCEGQPMGLSQINPCQFLGLEINRRAADIAEMVLWIGHWRWEPGTDGWSIPSEPRVERFGNIQCRDALIDYRRRNPVVDDHGEPISRWDGETYRTDPVTGRQVPDETSVVVDHVYESVTEANWPDADFIVGNPPFGGDKRARIFWGAGYTDAVRRVYGELPDSCDVVMYWWHKAAELTRLGRVRRFGFITTNSITQVFNRRVVASHLHAKIPLRLVFAVPDHPWVDAIEGAGVRISMTVGERGTGEGVLACVVDEGQCGHTEQPIRLVEKRGVIHANLRQGVDVLRAAGLQACAGIACVGISLHARSLVVTRQEAEALGLGTVAGLEEYVRPLRNGKDITETPRGRMVIDLFGLGIEEVECRFPAVYRWLQTRVKPERDAKANQTKCYRAYAKKWWLPGEQRVSFRPALVGLSRCIVTPMTTKHRVFVFLPTTIVPDQALVVIASADAYHLGVLSSRFHVSWALEAGGRLVDCPRYNKTLCFDTFAFPDATPTQEARIRDLGERLDAHRKSCQSLHPSLTLSCMYRMLHALRAGHALTEKERVVSELGVVNTLLELHDELDTAVAAAYGWSVDLAAEELVGRLVDLNAKRVCEEKQGKVRWLRPEYQVVSGSEWGREER